MLKHLGWLAYFSLVVLALGCTKPGLLSSKEHNIKTSAHTLDKGDWELKANILSPDIDDLMGALSVRYSPKENYDVETNLLHDIIGLYNITVKHRFKLSKDKKRAFSVKLGVKWFNPKYSLLLPNFIFDELSGLNILLIPFEVTGSQRLTSKLHMNVALGYVHTVLLPGNISTTSIQGGLGSREAYGRADLHYFVSSNFSIFLGTHVPFYQGLFSDAAIEQELAPGIIVGTQTAEWAERDKKPIYFGGFETYFLHTHFRMVFGYPMKLLTEYVPNPYISFDLFWRL